MLVRILGSARQHRFERWLDRTLFPQIERTIGNAKQGHKSPPWVDRRRRGWTIVATGVPYYAVSVTSQLRDVPEAIEEYFGARGYRVQTQEVTRLAEIGAGTNTVIPAVDLSQPQYLTRISWTRD